MNPLLNFNTKTGVKEQIKQSLKTCWRKKWEDNEIPTSSSFYLTSTSLRPKTQPDKIFKETSRGLFSHLTQALTGHSYVSEYYSQMHIKDNPSTATVIFQVPLYRLDSTSSILAQNMKCLAKPSFTDNSQELTSPDFPSVPCSSMTTSQQF